jgi:TonB family protein
VNTPGKPAAAPVPKRASGKADPKTAALAKIAEAHDLLLHQRALDVARFYALLGDAHKLAPSLDRRIAAEMRRFAILFVGLDSPDAIAATIDLAVKHDARLAFDDTLTQITRLIDRVPPEMERRQAARRAADAKKAAGKKEPPPVVVPYRELTPAEGLMPMAVDNLGQGVGGSDVSFWPRALTRTAPVDPRELGSPHETVMVTAEIAPDGRISGIRFPSRPTALEAAAGDAVARWTFEPFRLYGRPLKSTVRIPVTFAATSADGNASVTRHDNAVPSAGALPEYGEYVYVEELPEALTKVSPIMPANSTASGTVIIQALVGFDGRIEDTKIVKSIPELDEAAVTAVRQWTFKPAMAKGKPVAVWVAVPMRFGGN